MSEDKENTSISGERPRKKKKYLYLEKFDDYKTSTDQRLTTIEDSQLRLTFILSIVGLAFAAAAIIYGISA